MRSRLWAAAALALLVFAAIRIASVRQGPPSEAGRRAPGLPAAAQVGLAVDPWDGSLLKATAKGLFRSTDGGRTWKTVPVPANLAPSGVGQIAIHPEKRSIIYAAGFGTGVVVSPDGGTTWRRIVNGLPSAEVEALAMHAFRRETLFVTIRGRGAYRTEDAGGTWQRMDAGPEAQPVLALAHSPLPGSMNTGWLYAGTPEGPYISMDCF